MNSIIDVVGFFDQRIIQNDNEEMGETSTSTAKEIYCIHTVQIKLLSNLIPSNEEMSKLNLMFEFSYLKKKKN